MCGIFATTGPQEGARAALKALAHRGPDDTGMMSFPHALLGQTRLAIIDLSPGGHQPKKDSTQNIALTYNGEIYNYRALRKELEAKGHQFQSESDTEVVLKAYVEYGEECANYLDGMFAIALWDEEKQQLFLARDRFGKKPLYYAFTDKNEIVVASEIKALHALGIIPRLDPAGVDMYLSLMYSPPWRTVYSNVFSLLPGHCGVFKNGKLQTAQYWKLEHKPIAISYADAKEEVRRLFTEAVKKRMLAADVEVGALLSGGVDSTLVTAYAQQFLDKPLKTFSLGYGDAINELPFAEAASKKIGTEHFTLQASGKLTNELQKVLAYFDEPHGDSANFPQHLVSELASSKVKVALAGDGGDELFLGYGNYFAYWNRPKLVRIKNALFSNPYKEHLRSVTVFPASLRRSLFIHPPTQNPIDMLSTDFVGTDMERMNYFDLTTYLPGQLLTKVDQMSMMHGLEVRCPLLDHALAEFAFNLPEEYKTNRSTGKLILKDLLREILPNEFVDRKKQGFGAPVRTWLKEKPMRDFVEAQFKNASVYQFLKQDAVGDFIERTYRSDTPKPYYQLWVLLCLEVWLKAHPQYA